MMMTPKTAAVAAVKKSGARTLSTSKPTVKPLSSQFGSGPCKKRPGWSLDALSGAALGRSHRSKLGKQKLKDSIVLTKKVLEIPSDYHVGIVAGSDTGAFEMAMWSLLGPRKIDVLQWESFGKGWLSDATSQLKLKDKVVKHEAGYGSIPDLKKVSKENDVVFTWNGTTSGVRVPNGDWIASDRAGLTLCDATSAAFAMDLPWKKLDVTTYSWQKVLGGEGGHGMLVLSPRAVERLTSYTPAWPMPKIFRMTKSGKFMKEIFDGETINTPSMLCVEDYTDALKWADSLGGHKKLTEISEKNLSIVREWVNKNSSFASFLAKDPATVSCTSICLSLADITPEQIKKMVAILEKEKVAVDIGSYRDAPPGLRIWGGATVLNDDMAKLMPWLTWAYHEAKKA